MEKTIDNSNSSVSGFAALGIKGGLLASITALGFKEPTPIQEKSIPVALSAQDLIGIAQTGTGKTLAFGLPMIQRLAENKAQGLIIAPTRELATQARDTLKKVGKDLGLRTALLIGGEGMDRQLFEIRKQPHIIVATPGRLIDHLERRSVSLEKVGVLVLDEADMMFDMGFAPQIKKIISQAPKERQTLLFSATMPDSIVRLASESMRLPVRIEVARPGTAAEPVDQEIFIINHEERFDRLLSVLGEYKGSVLVFVRTKHGAHGLAKKLQRLGHPADEIHSNLSLGRRRSSLEAFKSGEKRILVATDVAARGLDINGIELVVNFNLPDNSGDYVHRIGRTGRAGRPGKAISFATPDEKKEIREIEKLINQDIKQSRPSGSSAPIAKQEVRAPKIQKPERPSRDHQRRHNRGRGNELRRDKREERRPSPEKPRSQGRASGIKDLGFNFIELEPTPRIYPREHRPGGHGRDRSRDNRDHRNKKKN